MQHIAGNEFRWNWHVHLQRRLFYALGFCDGVCVQQIHASSTRALVEPPVARPCPYQTLAVRAVGLAGRPEGPSSSRGRSLDAREEGFHAFHKVGSLDRVGVEWTASKQSFKTVDIMHPHICAPYHISSHLCRRDLPHSLFFCLERPIYFVSQ